MSKMLVWGVAMEWMRAGRKHRSNSASLRRENQFSPWVILQTSGNQRSRTRGCFLCSCVVTSYLWLLGNKWAANIKLLHLCCFIKPHSASHYRFISPGKTRVHCRLSLLDYILLMSGVSVFQLYTWSEPTSLCFSVCFCLFCCCCFKLYSDPHQSLKPKHMNFLIYSCWWWLKICRRNT